MVLWLSFFFLFVKGVVKVGAINCDEEPALRGRFGIQGFPTIKIFGADKKNPIDYNGARTAQVLKYSKLDLFLIFQYVLIAITSIFRLL